MLYQIELHTFTYVDTCELSIRKYTWINTVGYKTKIRNSTSTVPSNNTQHNVRTNK